MLVALLPIFAVTACSSSAPGITVPTSTPQGSVGRAITEFAPAERGKPISFSGDLDTGSRVTSAQWLGKVVVINFWYAACGPCRAEAPDLAALSSMYPSAEVAFAGINVRDQIGTARSFAAKFSIPYGSFLDADDGSLQLDFAGQIAPNAVPTTVVLDRQGRPAARIIGRIPARSILKTLIDDTMKETP